MAMDPRLHALRFFQGRGYSAPQAAGIVGNLQHESAFKPTIAGDNGTAVGLAQWRGDRLANLKRYAAGQGQSWNSIDTQLAFVDHELRTTEKSSLARLLRANSVQDATAAMVGYERPQGWTGPGSAQTAHGWNNRFGQARETMALAGQNPGPTQATPPSKADTIQLASAAGRSIGGLKSAIASASGPVTPGPGAVPMPGTADLASPGANSPFGDIMAGSAPPQPPAAALGATADMLNPVPISGEASAPPMAPVPPGGLMGGGASMLAGLGDMFGGGASTVAAETARANNAAKDAAIKSALYAGPLVQTAPPSYIRPSRMMG